MKFIFQSVPAVLSLDGNKILPYGY